MFEFPEYNIAPWGWELPLYFFLIGTAAMSFVLVAAPSTVGGGMRALEPVQKSGGIVTLVLIAVCGPLLIYDLGQPARFLYPIIHFHYSSPLSWGSVLLVLFAISVVVYLLGVLRGGSASLKPVAVLGSLLALTMPLYTGWDMMAQQARELWHSVSIPVLFVALSFSSGAAMIALIAQISGKMDEAATTVLRRVLLGSVGITLVLFIAEVLRLLAGSAEELEAWHIINTEFAFQFWGLTLVVGIIVPLVLLSIRQLSASPAVVTVAGLLGSIGAFAFRLVYVYAGQLPQLYY